jgi:phosphohistidine phosphatase
MELILWRHADAEQGSDDKERKLSAKGKKQAKRTAAWLRSRLPENAIVLTSPARRAMQTAEALTRRFRIVPRLGTDASASEILAASAWPVGAGAVVVVGHQPTLGRVAALVLTGAEADWKIRKGAIWWFEHDADEEDGSVALRAVVSPDSL